MNAGVWHQPMLLNYLKLSLRLLARNPFIAFINILGLSVGFSAFFILWQHATSELKTDQYHKDFEKIVRAGLYYRWTDDGVSWGQMTSGAIRSYNASLIANDFHEVESYTRILQQPQFRKSLVGHSNEVVISLNRDGTKTFFGEDQMVYADPNLFEFFSIPLLQGDKENVLEIARNVVLSETRAHQYFGNRNPVGEILMVNDTILLTVSGVFKDLPHATHLAFDLVISNVGLPNIWQEKFALTSCYFKLDNTEHIRDFEKHIIKNTNKYFFTQDLTSSNMYGLRLELFVQRLEDIAFSDPYEYDYRPQSKSKFILILLQTISVLILLMAWFNYINLGVSRMLKRMKEVATRKMSGALSSDFAKQFLVESCVINLVAVAVAFTILQLVRVPAMISFEVYIPEFSAITPLTWSIFGLVVMLGILITGTYPVVMSVSYSPRALFAVSKTSHARKLIQSFLTVVQYSTALGLILWAFIIYFQLNYILHKDLGIRKEQVIIVNVPVETSSSFLADFDYFLNSVRSTSGVMGATSSFSVIGDLQVSLLSVGPPASILGMDTNGGIDENFIPFYGIPILAGRNFNASDKGEAVIVSRYGAKRIGFDNPEDAVGFIGRTNTETEEGETKPVRIVGVIEDYRFKPLVNVGETSTESITGRGICLAYKNHLVSGFYPKKMSVRLDMNKLVETLAKIERSFHIVFPGNMFKWYFLDDHINKAYNNEKIALNQITLFTCIAIGISCLGLLGMMTLLAEEKTKEFGIRKVLGAGIIEIGKELLKNISRQVIIAIMIALPAAYYLTDQHLKRYLEKISLQWWHFAIPVVVLMSILFGTVAYVLWKAARANPVEALKYE